MDRKGETWKIRGNEYLQRKEYQKAIEMYGKAIEEDPKEGVYYANRALAYMKIDDYKHAESDINLAVQCSPKYVKAYLRRAAIHRHNGKYTEAKNDYKVVLQLESHNQEAIDGIKAIEKEFTVEQKLEKDVETIVIPSKCPTTVPTCYDEFERSWSECNDCDRSRYLDMIGLDSFKRIVEDNITSEILNQLAVVKADDKRWSSLIHTFKRYNLLKLFVNEKTKEWLA